MAAMKVTAPGTAVVAVAAAASLAAMPAAEPGKLLYSRADVVNMVTGEVSLRRAYTRQIELPSETCEGGALTCVVDRAYGQVYALGFVEETVSRGTDGKAIVDRRERGRLTIALDLPKAAETRLEDALVAHVGQLGAAEFARPRAGMSSSEEPLGIDILLQSAAPAWVCTELDGAYAYDLLSKGEHGDFRSHSRDGDDAKKACRAIEDAAQSVEPTSFRTMPDTRAQLRQEVRLSSFSTLKGLTWSTRLVPIPAGATFKKGSLSGDRKTGSIRDSRDGVFRGHEGLHGGVERDARLPRASLDLAGVPMWVTRWRFDAIHERYGEEPKSERDATVSLLVALAPFADPLMSELDRSRTDLFVPEESLVTAVMARFVRSAAVGPSGVADALADPGIWPSHGEWIVVTCRDDGSARYGITPFAEAAEVANPREACAAVRRGLEE
jgi:hypothetical protein